MPPQADDDFLAKPKTPRVWRAARRTPHGVADAVAGGLSAVAGGDEREAARQALVTEIRRQTSLNAGLSGLPAVHTRVLEALGEVPRHRFVPTRLIGHAYANRPLPIGYGQTISQPYIVALMTDLLEPEPDDVMLEVGTGSGYQAALLATLVRRVYTIEALRDYYALLRPGGFLVLTRWERQPPREGLKLFATAVAALRAAGVDPAARLAFIRSWQTDTLLARNGPLPAADIARIRAVCEQLGFDPVWFPGIEPHEVNRHHRVARPWLYEGAIALLGPVAGAAGAARAGRADAARHRQSGAGGNACAGLAAVARADSRPADHAAPAGILRSAPAGRLNAPRTTALLRMPSPTQRA